MGITANDDQETSIAGDGTEASLDPGRNPTKPRKRLITGFGVAMLFVLVIAVYMWRTTRTVIVSGRSMYPSFKTGDKVLVSKAYWLVGKIKDGDIVVLTDPNPDGYIIKRVYKMGGETVDWKLAPQVSRLGPYKVPDGMIYVLGDNLPESFDSRLFGPRSIDDVLGKVLANRPAPRVESQ